MYILYVMYYVMNVFEKVISKRVKKKNYTQSGKCMVGSNSGKWNFSHWTDAIIYSLRVFYIFNKFSLMYHRSDPRPIINGKDFYSIFR